MKVQEMKIPTLTVLGSGTLAAFITWATWKYIVSLVETPKLWTQLVEVFVPLIIGTSLYGLITYWAGVPAAKDIAKLLQQKLDKE
jgi:fluoride ion exporter CrcB/FEX